MKTQHEVKLTNRRVKSIFKKCMLQAEEIEFTEDAVVLPLIIEGISASYGISKDRVLEMKDNICSLVNQLPSEIVNGISFKSCFNLKDGTRWTSDEETLEMLLVLGVAVEAIKYVIPKNYWYLLPNEKPFVIKI